MTKPKVFFDADVLVAGSASTTGASHILLRLSEITLIEGIASQQAVTEAERNLHEKLSDAVPNFRALINAAAIQVIPGPSTEELEPYAAEADVKDIPILAAACLQAANFLVTFNTRHYWPPPDRIQVIKPGELLEKVRALLAGLGTPGQE